MPPYSITHVPGDAPAALETLGSKRKFWYYPDDDDDRKWLYKRNRSGTGEDWAEKVAAELCGLLGLPYVPYELAEWDGKRGVVCRQLHDDTETLHTGNLVLSGADAAYPRLDEERFVRVPEHTLARVFAALAPPVALPPGWSPPSGGITTAQDLFVGYLLLDAWIGNTDRHDKNWALVEGHGTSGSVRYLAPTYDHASSLGRELRDKDRHERLTSKDKGRRVPVYARRATSALFASPDDRKPMKTLDAFHEAAKLRPAAGEAWLAQLDSIPPESAARIFDAIPSGHISDTARTFAQTVLDVNRKALLDLRPLS